MTEEKTKPDSNSAPLPGPGVGFTFLYYFSMSIVIVLLAAQGIDLPIGSVELYRDGIVLGLLVGGAGVYFNRTASFEIYDQDSSRLQHQLEQSLADMRFELDADATEQQEHYAVYRRSGLARLFSGSVFVARRPTETQIVSRASILRQLQKTLIITD
ncbi:MAG: hypothetical protein ACFCU8_20140 [Thermosynechococcaceae cyanobacterium]